jgi:short-subunit dehydrogenase
MLEEERGGTIVTVSSVLAHLGPANLAAYAPAKAAVHSLHKTLTAELRLNPAAENVRTLLLEPGQMATPLFRTVQTPSRVLAPLLEPSEVARELVAAIDGGASGELALPCYARWIQWMNVLPVGVQRMVRSLAGVDRASQAAYEASASAAAAAAKQ